MPALTQSLCSDLVCSPNCDSVEANSKACPSWSAHVYVQVVHKELQQPRAKVEAAARDLLADKTAEVQVLPLLTGVKPPKLLLSTFAKLLTTGSSQVCSGYRDQLRIFLCHMLQTGFRLHWLASRGV